MVCLPDKLFATLLQSLHWRFVIYSPVSVWLRCVGLLATFTCHTMVRSHTGEGILVHHEVGFPPQAAVMALALLSLPAAE